MDCKKCLWVSINNIGGRIYCAKLKQVVANKNKPPCIEKKMEKYIK